MARKYREETYQVAVGRGFWWYVRALVLIVVAIIVIAAIL